MSLADSPTLTPSRPWTMIRESCLIWERPSRVLTIQSPCRDFGGAQGNVDVLDRVLRIVAVGGDLPGDADDLERAGSDIDRLTDRVLRREQNLRGHRTEDGVIAGPGLVEIGKEPAPFDLQAVEPDVLALLPTTRPSTTLSRWRIRCGTSRIGTALLMDGTLAMSRSMSVYLRP